MFVARKQDNSIYGCWTVKQYAGQEELPNDNPEVTTFLAPKPKPDLSDVDNVEKTIKTLALCIAQVGGLTVPQMKTLFKQKWDSLP